MIEIIVVQIQANFFERKKAALSLSNLYLTNGRVILSEVEKGKGVIYVAVFVCACID